MTRRPLYIITLLFILFALNACATYGAHEVGPTAIHQAKEQIPEEALMDVGIEVFQSAELSEEDAKDEGTTPEIRKAEGHYMPYHLKNTLQRSSHWGAVRVLPADAKGSDLLVRGEIIESNGEHLVVKVEAVDAAGNTWLNKTYELEADEKSYTGNVQGEKDAFQDLYNTVANDLAAYRGEKAPADLLKIRRISTLQFASDFAPEIFSEYLRIDKEGKVTIIRLPSDDDPMMERLLQIRERDNMYVDTLNEYYDVFYNEMWPAYEDWRKANQAEQVALRKIKREATMKAVGGVLLLVAAVALGSSDIASGALPGLMVVGGTALVVNGINVSREAEIHREAIKELSESFGNEMKPMVMEFQGKKYELTGSAEEQYRRWKELLRKIYFAETGFVPEGKAGEKHPKGD
ncbi:MAG: hypothetical protein JRJ82_09900 [Deltaproteobacteria bacterium]|nr:hypothetical protein [Deltaproteobacteria bacterium]